MEPLRRALRSVQPDQIPAGPLRVMGAANEVIRLHSEAVAREAAAGSFTNGVLLVRVRTAAAKAILHRDQKTIIEQLNAKLKERYGGPYVRDLVFRVATGQ